MKKPLALLLITFLIAVINLFVGQLPGIAAGLKAGGEPGIYTTALFGNENLANSLGIAHSIALYILPKMKHENSQTTGFFYAGLSQYCKSQGIGKKRS